MLIVYRYKIDYWHSCHIRFLFTESRNEFVRDVNILEFGNSIKVVNERLLEHSNLLSKQLGIALSILTNSPKLSVSLAVTENSIQGARTCTFACGDLKYVIEISDHDLDLLTKMHLSTPISDDDGTKIQFTNSHTHFLSKFGTTIGFLIFDKELSTTPNKPELTTTSINIEIDINGITVSCKLYLSKETIEHEFDKIIKENEGGSSVIAQGLIEKMKVKLTAVIGKSEPYFEDINQIKIGDFIELDDKRQDSDLLIEGNKVGKGIFVLNEEKQKGVKIL